MIVDEDDSPVGVATREEAWQNGLILRHAYCVLRDADGNFLLQQRSQSKKTNPGKWTWAATGHVDEGETYEVAAPREMLEEIGVQVPLTFVGKIRLSHPNPFGVLNAFVGVFTGVINQNTPITVDPGEVETTRWISPDELRKEITEHPENFSYNMRRTYEEFFASHIPR